MTRLFPLWAETLRLEKAQLVGIDLPLHAAVDDYRQAVAQIKYDSLSLGGLITTHKIDLMNATEAMFDTLDYHARLCQEVSCITKRDGKLIGHARDAMNSQRALQTMLGAGYWRKSGGHVLCLGAGGAGTALTVNLLMQPDPEDRPQRIVIVNDHQPGLDRLRAIVEQTRAEQAGGDARFAAARASSTTVEVEYVLSQDSRKNDQLMAALPPGSLVINATGMGKDRPGSPVTNEGVFPRDSIVWELNYRGALHFLHQARAQERERNLKVHDGWHYFIISWIDHIAEVFGLKVTAEQLKQLAAQAETMRS